MLEARTLIRRIRCALCFALSLLPLAAQSARIGNGTYDMAGNVKEWCWNESTEGRRFIMGGGFGEPNYMFYLTDARSPWERNENFGFRCARYDAPPGSIAKSGTEVW
jgi:hypothetical protein